MQFLENPPKKQNPKKVDRLKLIEKLLAEYIEKNNPHVLDAWKKLKS